MVPARSPFLVYFIGLLFGLQAISTDLTLPTLPAMQYDLQANMAQVQLSLTALLLSFGFAQLIWGVLSDRWGRKPILLLGLGLYSVAASLCFLAPNIEWLIVGRILQGLGMGASFVCARAMIRDIYSEAEGPIKMSVALTILGIAAVLSPIAGSLLMMRLQWTSAFAALLCIGSLTWLTTWLFVPETLQHHDKTQRGTLLLPIIRNILRHPQFQYYALVQAVGYAALFTFLATSSFTFMRYYQFMPWEYGLLVACNALAYFLGTITCRRLLKQWSIHTTLSIGASLAGVAGLAMLMLAYGAPFYAHIGEATEAPLANMRHLAWWMVFAPIAFYGFSHGITQPCAQATVIGPFPRTAGTAAALAGFLNMGMAFLVGQWLGSVMDDTLFPLVNGMIFWSLLLSLLVVLPYLFSSFLKRRER